MENSRQTRNVNNNVVKRMKWIKEINKNIIRSYYEATLGIPNQTYRKQMFQKWKEIYPENRSTEQRIGDQKKEITKRAESNVRAQGNWLTNTGDQKQNCNDERLRLRKESDEPSRPGVENAHKEPNVALEANREQPREVLPDNIVENAGQPHNDHEIQDVKDQILTLYAESMLTPFEERYDFKKTDNKAEKQLENAVETINKVIEDVTLLTVILTPKH